MHLLISLIKYSTLLLLLSACGAYFHQPMSTTHARIGEETFSTGALKQLPPGRDKIYVAVYKFRDQTGQYRPSSQGQNWSTAVTQGATNILIKAIENSNWFIPVERENVSNLLNERKIIRSSRAQYADPNSTASLLPPLLFAGIIIEGGIVSYDANLVTGGLGARYFGTGASAQYRQDRVSIYLRAISTQNGRILKTVYTSKTILSQAIDANLFRFVSFQKLLEAETGFTYNEPSELAVTEAIEKAVYALIIEGIKDGLWSPLGGAKDSIQLVNAYHKELAQYNQTDVFGRQLKSYRTNTTSVGLSSSGALYNGDLPDARLAPGARLDIEFAFGDHFALGVEYGSSKIKTREFIDDFFNYSNLYTKYRLIPYDRFSPYLEAGVGLFVNTNNQPFNFSGQHIGQLTYGLGIEFILSDRLGAHLSARHQILFNDQADQVDQGVYNDMYMRVDIGLRYYIGKKNDKNINIYE